MLPLPKKRPKSATALRRRMNWWSPLFFTGIQITYLSDDYTHCRARLRNWHFTKNSHRSQFGGSLFALTDPIYPIMLSSIFGDRYYVWDKEAHIDFIKPGYGEVYLDCHLTMDDLESIKSATDNGEKHLPQFTVRIFDKNGETVAVATRTLYVRLKKEYRPQN